MPYVKRRSCRTCCRVLCNSQTLKTRQIRHRFIRRRSALAGCYAIEADHRLKGALQPDRVLDYRREPRIRGDDLVLPFDVAQHEMREHRCPYLPFHRILVLSEEPDFRTGNCKTAAAFRCCGGLSPRNHWLYLRSHDCILRVHSRARRVDTPPSHKL